MPVAPALIDPFHRLLYGKIQEQLEKRVAELAAGSAATIQGDTKTVAEKYAAQVGYIQALQDVVELCQEIELDRYGKREEG